MKALWELHCKMSGFPGLCFLKTLVFPSERIRMPRGVLQSVHTVRWGWCQEPLLWSLHRHLYLCALHQPLPVCPSPGESLHSSGCFSELNPCLNLTLCPPVCLKVHCGNLDLLCMLIFFLVHEWCRFCGRWYIFGCKSQFATQTGSSLNPLPPLSASALLVEKSRTHSLGRVKPEVYPWFLACSAHISFFSFCSCIHLAG